VIEPSHGRWLGAVRWIVVTLDSYCCWSEGILWVVSL
jgi:hypothetical protein